MKLFTILFSCVIALACNQSQSARNTSNASLGSVKKVMVVAGDTLQPIVKTEAEWKAQLSAKEYYVLREKGTERSFTGDLLKNKEEGTYTCAACALPLFSSEAKFKSGTGWPSFWEPVDGAYVAEEKDESHGMTRIEVLCARCDGHLGHIFPDGPEPTGLRYCINSVSLDFVPK